MERKAKVKKWIRRLGIVVGICLAICLMVRAFNIFWFANTGTFVEHDRSCSPDGKFDAVLMYYDSEGATGLGAYMLYIVPAPEEISRWKLALSEPVFEAEWAESTIAHWESNKDLKISYSGDTVYYLQSKWSPLMSGRKVTLRLADPNSVRNIQSQR
jgi:hypothetical protein